MAEEHLYELKLKTVAHKAEVNFQRRAWFDIGITLWLIEDVLVPYINTIRDTPEEWVLLIMDGNGRVHISKEVKECCHKHKILVWYAEPAMSHKCNDVDRSIGKVLKDLARSASVTSHHVKAKKDSML